MVSFGGLPFDFLGFSHVPAIRPAKERPRSVVGDVLLGACNKWHADSFIRRLETSGSKSRTFPLPFILARVFLPDAHALLKKKGVLPWTHQQFFNKGMAEAITQVLRLVQSFSVAERLDPQAFWQALKGVEHYGDIFGSIKGCMFELCSAPRSSTPGTSGASRT